MLIFILRMPSLKIYIWFDIAETFVQKEKENALEV